MHAESTIGGATGRMQAALLETIRLDLDRLIRPDLRSPEARMAAQLASEMLCFLTVGAREQELADAQAVSRLRGLVARAEALVGGQQGGAEVMPADELGASVERSKLASQLAHAVSLLAGNAAGGDARARSVISEALAQERKTQLDLHELVRAEMAELADPVAAVETELDVARLDAYFRQRTDALSIRVTQVERIPGGYSKDTFRFSIDGQLDGHARLILRRDLPFGPGENSVVDEFELLNALYGAGLKVPQPLLCEPDARHVGRPFLVFPQYAGSAVFGDWHAPPAERERVCRDVARFMAQLHSLDPFAKGLATRAPGMSPQSVVRDYVRHWRAKWMRRRVHPSVILEIAFDWLERNAPASLGAVSIVHGDISFRNTLIDQGALTVLLDWEFWHLGDPMEDLSYFRLVAEPYVDWSIVMDEYRAAGGSPYSPERAAFYEVWRSVRNATTTTTAWNGFLSGAYPASKAAYQGVSLYRLFLRDVADKLAGVEPGS